MAMVSINQSSPRSRRLADFDSEDEFSEESDPEELSEEPRLLNALLMAPRTPEFFSAVLISCFFVLVYLWGVITLIRVHVWVEAVFTVVLPLYMLISGWQRQTESYQQKLIVAESTFCAIAILAKIAILAELAIANTVANYMFLVFLLAQFGYYAVFCAAQGMKEETSWNKILKGSHYFTAIMAVTMLVSVIIQRLESDHWSGKESNTIGEEGQLMVWGEEAGIMIKLNYLFWIIYVLFCDDMDTKLTKPGIEGYMLVPMAQLCSVVLAWLSGEFWHARMVTAVHLVVLDGVLHTHNSRWGRIVKSHGEFCVMPAHWYRNWSDLTAEQKKAAFGRRPTQEESDRRRGDKPWYVDSFVPAMKWAMLVLCVVCPIMSAACGSHQFYCGMYVGVHNLWNSGE
jgi:hypothetical protein